MKKISITLLVALLTFAISAYSTSTDIPLSQYQKNMKLAKQYLAGKELKTLSRCKAYTHYISTIADIIIEGQDPNPKLLTFVNKSKEYDAEVNKNILKYHTIAIEPLNEEQIKEFNDKLFVLYQVELTAIRKYSKENPEPSLEYAQAFVTILDRCTEKELYI